jgi:hypothetical protein
LVEVPQERQRLCEVDPVFCTSGGGGLRWGL